MIDGTDAYIMDLMCGKYTTKQERSAGRLFKAVYSQAYDKYGSAYNKKRNGAHMAWQADFSQGAQVRLMADGEPTEYYMTYVGKNIWNEGDKTVYWTLWSEYQCAPVLTASREECCECAGVPCMKKKQTAAIAA